MLSVKTCSFVTSGKRQQNHVVFTNTTSQHDSSYQYQPGTVLTNKSGMQGWNLLL